LGENLVTADQGYRAWNDAEAQNIAAALAREPGALMPILHALNDAFGHVPDAAVPIVAQVLNLSRADVHGVLTFYHDFKRHPPARHSIKLCRAEACQARGSRALQQHAEQVLGIAMGETTPGGGIALEAVYCLGNCAHGPSALIDGVLQAELDSGKFDAQVASLPTKVSEKPTPRRPGDGIKIFVPGEASAKALGADAVARAIADHAVRSNIAVDIVRTGGRGAFWLEPLIEVQTAGGRIAYANVAPADVPSLFAADFLKGGAHAKRIGDPAQHDWFKHQTRLTFARCGVVDPLSLQDYAAHGGLVGLKRALSLMPTDVVTEIETSGLRGRGGAGFPAGRKWRTVLETPGPTKYIVCNADEGDSGTFADRLLMEGDPFLLVEGMVIAGVALGAEQGFVYLRSEYPDAARVFGAALAAARAGGLLGESVLGSGKRFDISLRMGAGAYICGEETSLLESLEGKRGQVRFKPPIPAIQGLFGKPTLINNVLTLAAAPTILAEGGAAYAAHGTGRSRGTLTVQLAGNVKRGGLVEIPFGLSLRELIDRYGGGTDSGRKLRAVQVGGPLGAYLPDSLLDLPLDYEALASAQAMLGHGGVVVFDDTVDMAAQARFAFEFCAIESCGKCTPCRIGSARGVETIDRLVAGDAKARALIDELCETLVDGSLCALGGLTPLPVQSCLRHFPEDFRRAPAQAAAS
jgi:formate dehydrogenase iron-sulfur subunit